MCNIVVISHPALNRVTFLQFNQIADTPNVRHQPFRIVNERWLVNWVDNRFYCLLFVAFFKRFFRLADPAVFLEILMMSLLPIWWML